ncbi:MAG: hypothetical protein NVS9B11_19580 [Candidatus Dormibacteraceae bacterium]
MLRLRLWRRRFNPVIVVLVWSLLLVPLAMAAVVTESNGTDTLAVTDKVTASLTAAFRPALGEVLAVAEAVGTKLFAAFRPALAEGLAIGDQVSTTLRAAFRPALAEGLAIGDQVSTTLRAAFRPALAEGLAIGDQIAIIYLSAAQVQIAELAAAVNAAPFPLGTRTSLLASVNAAQTSITGGKTAAACGQLEAFTNKVQAQSGKSISSFVANELLRTVRGVEAAIPCPRTA